MPCWFNNLVLRTEYYLSFYTVQFGVSEGGWFRLASPTA